ncbi:MAG: phosphoglycerate dehydrogenase [Proteobacteria bacterium]|nr:phosphoglycerate dehydrogenase [Pseudomonadota bacterium]
MNTTSKVAVCSRSFSQNSTLRAELLTRYQHVTFNDAGRQLTGEDLVEFLRGHDKAIVALETIDASLLSRLPELKVVSKFGVGLDMLDLGAMKKNGVRLGWTAGVNKRAVSELVVAFSILMLRKVPAANLEVREGVWRQHKGSLLSGKTVGIIGCGPVGRDVALLMQAFGCEVLVNDVADTSEFCLQHQAVGVSLAELLGRADVVTIHTPLNNSTRNLLHAENLALMKPGAILVNLARGGLVDEQALKSMLKEGRLAAAAFDVFAQEPPTDQELIRLPNFLATPHIGGSAHEAILAMGRAAIEGLDRHSAP